MMNSFFKINAITSIVRTIFFLAFTCKGLLAQVPQGISYQAVARNGQGQTLANTNVKLRFSILDSIATGTVVYVESHNTTTSALGLFTANVGMGTASTGTFSSINWGQNSKFLKVELDTTATGNSYIDLGTQQMMSVPYALYAKNSGNTLGISNSSSGNNNCYNCPSMLSSISSNTMSVMNASQYCSLLTYNGYDDWRLPTLSEFEFLRDVVNLIPPSFDCWTKDFTILGNGVQQSWTAPVYVSTNRNILVGGLLNTICVR
jgi:hypothetical protein